ncbi:MAG: hypothetical protein MUE30_12510 [Spirosomaceae bacterium]|nr:hypothetical protein [Spirosomataceae bacterium]
MKNLLIFAGTLLLLSCRNESETELFQAQNQCPTAKVTDAVSDLKSDDGIFGIHSEKITETTLSAEVSFGGGCDPNHKFELYLSPNRLIAGPLPYFDARIVFTTTDYCKRLDQRTLCFDLTAFRKQNPNAVIVLKKFQEK